MGTLAPPAGEERLLIVIIWEGRWTAADLAAGLCPWSAWLCFPLPQAGACTPALGFCLRKRDGGAGGASALLGFKS